MKKIYIVLGITFLMMNTQMNAQENSVVQADSSATTEAKPEAKPKTESAASKIYYGGTVGLSFGSYTRIGVYPMVAYKVTPKLSSGVKIGYEYISDSRYTTTYTTSNYGWSVFGRYRIIPALYAHIEYEMINYELYNLSGSSEREWVPFILVGGGYSKKMSARSWLNAQVLFDVLNDENSPYEAGSPYFSIGIGVGF